MMVRMSPLLYLVCLAAGTAAFLALLVRSLGRASEAGPVLARGPGAPLGEEFTVPGARIEPSDEFAVEGGAGGAEGEGGSPGYDDGADGGVGGAEGGPAGLRVERPLAVLGPAAAAFVAGFGGGGYLGSSAGLPGAAGVAAAAVGGVVLAVAGGAAAGAVRDHEGRGAHAP